MALSDMLFNNTHSVEELVNIKKQKKVDKVLLKVIRVVRSKGKLDGWVKPEANFKTDLKLSDKVITSIKKTLGDYYNIDLMKNKSLMTAKAIVVYIKTNRANVADSIFLVNVDQTETDEDDEVQVDDEMVDPNIANPRPVEEEPEQPNTEPVNPAKPEEPQRPEVGPDVPAGNPAPVIDQPEDQLAEDPDKVQESESDVEPETPASKPTEVGNDVEVSTEGLSVSKGKMVWTYVASEKEIPKNVMITVGAGSSSRYICQVFPTKDALITAFTKSKAPIGVQQGKVIPYAVGIPFNFIKKSLGKRGNISVINAKVRVPSNICILDRIPTAKYSKEGLDAAPTEAQSWADVMNSL